MVICLFIDTMIEQDYLINECLPSLSEFCNDFGFVCDIVHLSSKQNKLPGKNWAFQDKSMGLPLREIDEMKLFGMPVIMLVCFCIYNCVVYYNKFRLGLRAKHYYDVFCRKLDLFSITQANIFLTINIVFLSIAS